MVGRRRVSARISTMMMAPTSKATGTENSVTGELIGGMTMGVAVGTGVSVGSGVGVKVGAGVAVGVAVDVAVGVGVIVGVRVIVGRTGVAICTGWASTSAVVGCNTSPPANTSSKPFAITKALFVPSASLAKRRSSATTALSPITVAPFALISMAVFC